MKEMIANGYKIKLGAKLADSSHISMFHMSGVACLLFCTTMCFSGKELSITIAISPVFNNIGTPTPLTFISYCFLYHVFLLYDITYFFTIIHSALPSQ